MQLGKKGSNFVKISSEQKKQLIHKKNQHLKFNFLQWSIEEAFMTIMFVDINCYDNNVC